LTVNDKKKDHDLAALYGVVDRCGIVISEKRAADFTTKDIEGDIKRLLGKDTEAPTLRNSLQSPTSDLSSIRSASRNGSRCLTHQIPWRTCPPRISLLTRS
jgi:hypothetical protein